MRSSLLAVAAVTALAAAPRTARADDGGGGWYGYQVLAADLGGWALIGVGGKTETWPLAALGAAGVLLGGPAVHAAHGNYGRMGVSLGLRFGGPLLGVAIGAVADRGSHSFIPTGPILGLCVGYFVGALVDIVVVADDPDDGAPAPRMLSFGGRF